MPKGGEILVELTPRPPSPRNCTQSLPREQELRKAIIRMGIIFRNACLKKAAWESSILPSYYSIMN
uniref:Uncharacterized protein n=1 Tax=uncultured bacterium contig00100 TaxID=1181567 RepID=A0A806KHZ3_9BACT|nr:hypothetical protein [uncultured bacterium contig00100]